MRRSFSLTFTILALLTGLTACAVPAPQATQDTTAEQTVIEEPTEEPAEEPAEAMKGETATYIVDTEASSVEWLGSKPIGASDSGTVDIAEGTMSFDGDQFVDGTITIDMTTIATTSQSGGMAEQLVGHLSSDDFFGVETYPTSILVIKSAEPTDVDNQYLVKADLTIKETTGEIEFTTDVTVGDGTLTATADIVFDRAEFNVQYGSGSFFDNLGDKLINDEVEMTVTLVANN
ncbi:YceI family protein [Chloroflexi bacterium TSY]|nr:YceI family protein [Chloroflexi bacterium TSY]